MPSEPRAERSAKKKEGKGKKKDCRLQFRLGTQITNLGKRGPVAGAKSNELESGLCLAKPALFPRSILFMNAINSDHLF